MRLLLRENKRGDATPEVEQFFMTACLSIYLFKIVFIACVHPFASMASQCFVSLKRPWRGDFLFDERLLRA